jgi:hypothetical protein
MNNSHRAVHEHGKSPCTNVHAAVSNKCSFAGFKENLLSKAMQD